MLRTKNIEFMISIFNNYVFKYLYIYLIIISFILFMISFLSLNKKKTSRINKLSKEDILVKIISYPVIIFAKLIRPKSEKRKEEYKSKFARVGINTNFEKFHIVKALMPIFAITVILTIHYTNSTNQVRELLNTEQTSTADITNDSIGNETLLAEQELEIDKNNIYGTVKREYEDYKTIEESLVLGELSIEEEEKVINEFKAIIVRTYEYDEDIALNISKQIYNLIPNIVALRTLDFKYYLIAILTIFLPDLVLFFMGSYKKRQYKEGIEMLKITTLILGSMEGMTVKKTLESLKNIVPAYKSVLNDAINSYNSIQDGSSEAIMNMALEVNIPEFRKLCSILKEISTGNKTTAIQNLEADMILEDKESEMVGNDKIEKKTWIAILLIAPSMLFLMMLLLMPFAKYYQNINL